MPQTIRHAQIGIKNNQTGEYDLLDFLKGDKGEGIEQANVTSLNSTVLANSNIIEAIGIPEYVSDISLYSEYGITETGWYVFARIDAPENVTVTPGTVVTGAAGAIKTVGAAYVDVAVRFEVAALAQTVTVNWGSAEETLVFYATDLAIRNLDYRTTFYVYDLAPYVTWQYAITTDTAFVADKKYYTESDGVYTLAEATTGETVPAYYVYSDDVYTQVTGTFDSGVTYYIKNPDTTSETAYIEATVTAGEPIPAYYNHSKIIISGMVRNITYRFDETIDCPMEFILPEIEDETHGCWFEMRFRHAGEYSMTLVPPSDNVKIATEHTQKETAGINMIDLHYTVIDGLKIWRFMNTHSSIPTDASANTTGDTVA